jgi:hypothetical protein
MESAPQQPTPVQLTVTLGRGMVVLPSWLALLFVGLFVVSCVTSTIVLWVESHMIGEVRVMQIYEQDIENVLIRANLATRSDFAPHPAQGGKK